MILVIWILLVFPMVVVYDKDKQVRFLACGLLYYFADAYFDNKRGGR